MSSRPARTIRVAFDGRSLSSEAPRGWDRYTIELLAQLPRFGVEPCLLFREGHPLCASHVDRAGCRTLGIPARTVSIWEQVELPRALASGGFDLYHAPAERGVPFVRPCPSVLTLHSLTYHSYAALLKSGKLTGSLTDYIGPAGNATRFTGAYTEAQFRAADHVLVPSRFCADEVVTLLGLERSRTTVTPLGVPSEFADVRFDAAAVDAVLARYGITRPYVLYVGGYERHKNISALLRVALQLADLRPDLTLVFVGTKAIPEQLARHASARRVFLADVTRDLVALYDGASAFISMSWRETFCLPVLEALSRGVPAVASSWGAARDLMTDDSGVLVDPRSVEEGVDGVLRLLSAPPDRSALIARARRFSWATTAELTRGVYDRVLTEGARGSVPRLARSALAIARATASALRAEQ